MPDSPTLKHSVAYRWRLPITIIALLAGWLGSLFSQPWIAEHSRADHWLDGVGWLLVAAGIAVRAWASREISGRKRHSIVDTGPYALCRNPLYWGTLLLALAQLSFLRSLSFLLALCVPVGLYLFGVVPAEERYLAAVLDEPYREYCRRTPRWWPRWNPKAWSSLALPDHRAYRRELLSHLCWAALPFIAELIGYCRELPGWPHWPVPFF